MTSRAPFTFRHVVTGQTLPNSTRSFPPDKSPNRFRHCGGFFPAMTTEDKRRRKTRLSKFLVSVNIESRLRPVQLIISPENTVRDLIKAAIEIYTEEKRRPLLRHADPDAFDLHLSQFTFQSLKPDEKLMKLGCRNFFMCSKP